MLPIGHRLAAQPLDHVDGAVDDDEIEPAIVVVIDPAGAEAGHLRRCCGEACAHAGVFEIGRAVVHVHRVGLGGDVSHEQIFVAVVVRITQGDPHAAFGPSTGIHRRCRRSPRSSNVPLR